MGEQSESAETTNCGCKTGPNAQQLYLDLYEVDIKSDLYSMKFHEVSQTNHFCRRKQS